MERESKREREREREKERERERERGVWSLAPHRSETAQLDQFPRL